MTKDQKLDEKSLRLRNLQNYISRMKRNKYWKKGYRSAKNGQSKDEIPYKFPDEVVKLIRKRTLWLMGFEDFDSIHGKNGRLKEIANLRKLQKKDNDKVLKKMERHKERNKHKKKKKYGKRRD